MKTLPPNPGRSGAVLVFALLLLVVGALVLGGVAQMTATQSVAGQTEWTAAQRRITLENSRAMARQFLLSRMFMFTNGSPAVTATNGLGRFELTARGDVGNFWETASETSTNAMLNINPFNLMERGGFYRVWIPGEVWDGMTNVDWNFQVRTRSPIAAGYTFVRQRPSTASVLFAAAPYINMGAAGAFVGYEGLPRLPVSSVTNTNTNDTTGYMGYLDVPIGASQAGDFTNVTFQLWTNSTTLQAVLDLSAVPTGTNSVLKYTVPQSATFTNGSNYAVRAIQLRGAPGGAYDFPVHVEVPAANTNVTTLVLTNNNLRRVYVNVQRSAFSTNVFTVRTTNNPTFWRLGMSASKMNVTFNTGMLPITGGIRSDADVLFPAGASYFTREADPGGLDVIADRMMWLEDNRAL
ncbi:MAG: hypothetical protein IAE97_14855 [Chthoniobacterales bacterium]|nr:hypothetical protein [Chthoniobacterales bacterium]